MRVVGRFVRRQVKGAGVAPGTLVHTGKQKMERVRIRAIDYDAERLRESEVDSVDEVLALRDAPSVSWINIDGLHDVDLVRRVGEHFGLHPLVLEDLVHVGQRPKAEAYPGYDAVVLPMLDWDEEGGFVREEQLSLILGPSWILTFQERVGDSFEPVRERLRGAKGRIRARGADYLAYALIDAVVDRYFAVLERIGAATEELELEVLERPGPDAMARLHRLKRELIVLRRAVWPVRDLLNGILRGDSERFEDETRVFVRDVYDHSVQVIETVESLRDVVSGAIDLYLSNVSHRTNEVMKVLTIMASIFIPLTFMAGIYGMNFEHMPELAVPWAYPALWGAMIAVALGMVVYFRRRDWL
ncbi:MAG: magnesium/cobalt transporter CorA [Gemmatimonadetes bacterium]|nr:magnesium/cobalt transporter CorA [Gemmatimonadota bacterium]NNK64460.1 magnesium/cobalt transporter CorA [Gemmatimonadota bacterium]